MDKDIKGMINGSEAFIFDVDGVLIDSEPIWHEAQRRLFKRDGIPYDEEIYRYTTGRGIKTSIELFRSKGVKGEPEELTRYYTDLFYRLALEEGRLRLMDGVEDVVRRLHGLKPIGVATGGHTKDMFYRIAERFNIKGLFSAFVSGYDVARGKPAPDIFLLAAERLKAEPSRCLVFEDAIAGIQAAKNADMKAFGINGDAEMRSKLVDVDADAVFSSFREVSPYLEAAI